MFFNYTKPPPYPYLASSAWGAVYLVVRYDRALCVTALDANRAELSVLRHRDDVKKLEPVLGPSSFTITETGFKYPALVRDKTTSEYVAIRFSDDSGLGLWRGQDGIVHVYVIDSVVELGTRFPTGTVAVCTCSCTGFNVEIKPEPCAYPCTGQYAGIRAIAFSATQVFLPYTPGLVVDVAAAPEFVALSPSLTLSVSYTGTGHPFQGHPVIWINNNTGAYALQLSRERTLKLYGPRSWECVDVAPGDSYTLAPAGTKAELTLTGNVLDVKIKAPATGAAAVYGNLGAGCDRGVACP